MPRTPRVPWWLAALASLAMLYACYISFVRSPQGTDFPDFYCAARMVADGLGHQLYDLPVQWQYQAQLTGRVGSPFIHPPFEALLYLPFAVFPMRVAYLLWSLFCLALLAVAARWLDDRLAASGNAALWFLLFLAFTPVSLSLLQGQDSIVLLLIFTLTFCRMDDHPFEGGAWLALGLIKFQLAIPVALILMTRKRWRFAAGFLAGGGALFLISIAISGIGALVAYPRFLLNLGRISIGGVHPNAMANLRGLCALVFAATPRAGQAALLLVSLVVVLVALDGWRKATGPGSAELAISSTVLAAVLVSYHANPHDLVLLLIPLAVTAVHLHRTHAARSSTRWFALLITALVLALPPVYLWSLHVHQFAPLAVPIILLLGLTYSETRRSGSSG
jgi:Glycosyltransferase family 87